jgi:hypothetical protein
MTPGQERLREKLAADIKRIYRDGFPRFIEAQTIPVLAELAEALSPTPNDGKNDYCRDTVEALIRRALVHLPAEDAAGVAELLGINEPDKQKIGVRQDRAAEHFERGSGDSLRHREEGGRKVIDIRLEDDLAGQLVALAASAKFEYGGRFEPGDDSRADAEREPSRVRHRSVLVGVLVVALVCVGILAATRPNGAAASRCGQTKIPLAKTTSEAESTLYIYAPHQVNARHGWSESLSEQTEAVHYGEIRLFAIGFHTVTTSTGESIVARIGLPADATLQPSEVCVYRHNRFSSGARYPGKSLLATTGLQLGSVASNEWVYITFHERLPTITYDANVARTYGRVGAAAELSQPDWTSTFPPIELQLTH